MILVKSYQFLIPFSLYTIKINAGGMNGSIVYELERPENAGLKKSLKACTQSLMLFLL
jgi:L-ascorbate peroxidase